MLFRVLCLFALTLVSACSFFPSYEADKTGQLYSRVLIDLRQMEASGILDPATPSVVVLNRYGTTFGTSMMLRGRDGAGNAMDAAAMVAYCQRSLGSEASSRVKSCLRDNFTAGEDLEFSHGGFAFNIPGRGWMVRQSLRSNDSGDHFEWFGTMENFVDIALVDYRIQIIALDEELQQRLARILTNSSLSARLIHPTYNLLARPFETDEQMSNQYILEILAAGMQPVEWEINRTNAQYVLREQGYRPTVVLARGLHTLTQYENLFSTIDLHRSPYAKAYQVTELISTQSVKDFLLRTGRATQVVVSEI